MVEPVIWLVNSDFKPVWLEGMKPLKIVNRQSRMNNVIGFEY